MEKLRQNFRSSIFSWVVLTAALMLLLTLFAIPPKIFGDTTSYLTSLEVLSGREAPDFSPHRVLTSLGGLLLIKLLTFFSLSSLSGWILLNSILYIFALSIFFYLLRELSFSYRSSLIGMFLLGFSYPFISFGPHWLMDMGGWAGLLAAMYFALLYTKKGQTSHLFFASLAVGLGASIKEYALLGALAILAALIYQKLYLKRSFLHFLLFGIVSAIVFLGPLALQHYYTFQTFNYSYLDWLSQNSQNYSYPFPLNIVEYIKVFGSLYLIGWLFFLPGLVIYLRSFKKNLFRNNTILVALLVALPVFSWAAITQRIYAVFLPFLILVSLIFLEKLRFRPALSTFIISLYALGAFLTDSFILNFVNLNSLLS